MSVDSRQISVRDDFPLNGKVLDNASGLRLKKTGVNQLLKGELARTNDGKLVFIAENNNITILIDENGVIPAGSVSGIAGVSLINGKSGPVTLRLKDIYDVSTAVPSNGATIVWNASLQLWSYSNSIGSDKTYEHVQTSASRLWTVNHNLNKMPSTQLLINGHIAYTDIEILPTDDANYLKKFYVRFLKPQTGQIICN